MAGLGDMLARAQAAQGMMRGGEEGAPPPEMGMEEELGAAPPAVDIEGALGGVEAAIEAWAPPDAEEARTHVNAIREIAARAAEAGTPEPEMPAEEGGMPPSEETIPPMGV